jgi:hypothetical protein
VFLATWLAKKSVERSYRFLNTEAEIHQFRSGAALCGVAQQQASLMGLLAGSLWDLEDAVKTLAYAIETTVTPLMLAHPPPVGEASLPDRRSREREWVVRSLDRLDEVDELFAKVDRMRHKARGAVEARTVEWWMPQQSRNV